jgi:hypothetical protein
MALRATRFRQFLLLLSGRLHRSYRSESAITVFLTLAGDRAVLEDAFSRDSVANGPIAAPVPSALFPDIFADTRRGLAKSHPEARNDVASRDRFRDVRD